jgi:hypothetical protein
VPICPFCSRARIERTHQTELLAYYRCDYCFKEWGQARIGREAPERAHAPDAAGWRRAAVDDSRE